MNHMKRNDDGTVTMSAELCALLEHVNNVVVDDPQVRAWVEERVEGGRDGFTAIAELYGHLVVLNS